TPFGNELVELVAERAIEAEKLGRHETTDILAVSFSSNDYVGHIYGPDSPEAHDTALRTDKLLDKLFRYLDTQIGMSNVLVVLTADHGAAAVPELSVERKLGGGRIPPSDLRDAVEARLDERFGNEHWIMGIGGGLNPKFFEYLSFYLDRDLV